MSFRDVQNRFRAIVQGLGADGSLGAAAQARACTVDRFRVTEQPDPSAPDATAQALDRGTNVTLTAVSDLIPRNVYCNERQVRAVLEIRVGYAAAPSQWQLVHDEATDSDKQAAAADWGVRALDDARELERALTWYELTGLAPLSPAIERVAPLGEVQLTDLGNGRALMLRRFEVWMEDRQP